MRTACQQPQDALSIRTQGPHLRLPRFATCDYWGTVARAVCLHFIHRHMEAQAVPLLTPRAPHLHQRGHVALEGSQLCSRQRGGTGSLHAQRVVQCGLQVGHVQLGAGEGRETPSPISPLILTPGVSPGPFPAPVCPAAGCVGSDRSARRGCATRSVSLELLAVAFSL